MKGLLTIFPPPARRPAEEPIEVTGPDTVESLVLRKLLAELARAQSPYPMEYSPARTRVWVRATLALAWALSLLLCIIIVKYIDGPPAAPAVQNSGESRYISNLTGAMAEQNRQFLQMAHSIETLASAVSSSAVKMAALRRERDPKPAAFQPGAPAVTILQQPQAVATVQTLMGSHRHQSIEAVVPMNNVIVHHNESGVMDYWLVPRNIAGAMMMVKVVPIAQNSLGIFVHGVEDSTDYIVTPSGDWLVASVSSK